MGSRLIALAHKIDNQKVRLLMFSACSIQMFTKSNIYMQCIYMHIGVLQCWACVFCSTCSAFASFFWGGIAIFIYIYNWIFQICKICIFLPKNIPKGRNFTNHFTNLEDPDTYIKIQTQLAREHRTHGLSRNHAYISSVVLHLLSSSRGRVQQR